MGDATSSQVRARDRGIDRLVTDAKRADLAADDARARPVRRRVLVDVVVEAAAEHLGLAGDGEALERHAAVVGDEITVRGPRRLRRLRCTGSGRAVEVHRMTRSRRQPHNDDPA